MNQVMSEFNAYRGMLERIKLDPRYKEGVEYGKPRPGHAEGTVKAHIAELEENLNVLRERNWLMEGDYEKLMILIHVHDTFKYASARNVSIVAPDSHSTLAKNFLAEFTSDSDLLNICQYHDVGYSIFRKFKNKGVFDSTRLNEVINKIEDIELFLMFAIIDSCTKGKGREAIKWLVSEVCAVYPFCSVDADWILDPDNIPTDGSW